MERSIQQDPISRNVLLAAALAVCLAGSPNGAAQGPPDALRSPRATVRTLLMSVSTAHDRGRHIEEAIACLDLSDVAGNHSNAGLLAMQLEAILRAQRVDTNVLPDSLKGDEYVFPNGQGQRIALRRMQDGRWLFDRATVAHIPSMWADAQKSLQERNREAAALEVSPDYLSPRATLHTFLSACIRQDFERAARCLDLDSIPAVARQEVGRQLASRLKQVLDRDHLIVLQEVPDTNYGDPYVLLSQREGVVEIARQSGGPRKGEWLFTESTTQSIDNLYDVFEDRPLAPEFAALGFTPIRPDFRHAPELWLRGLLPAWMKVNLIATRSIHIEVFELLGLVLLAATAFAVNRFLPQLLNVVLQAFLRWRGWAVSREVTLRRLRPTGRLACVLYVRWGLLILSTDQVVLIVVLTILNPLAWALAAWALYRLLDLLGDVVEARVSAHGGRVEITHMLWPVGSLATKIAVFVATLFYLMSLFAWDVTAVLTGLGIGGLAFALGAQDTLKNLFGSFTLIADRPFVVGERVKIGNDEEGIVETFGLRSTRIRSADDVVLTVPNSNLTTMHIINYGRGRRRRYKTTLSLLYSTPPTQLVAFRDGITELIRQHPRTRKDRFYVRVNGLGASAIEVLVIVFFEVLNDQEELEAREQLILAILELAETLRIEFALPSHTVYLAPTAARANALPVPPGDGTPTAAPAGQLTSH
jgi:MscS family membrane protein